MAATGSQRAEKAAEIGKRLLHLMRVHGVNQTQLAKRAGVGRDMISNYIRGKHTPRIENAELIATALGVPLEDILGVEPEPELTDLTPGPGRPLTVEFTGDGAARLRMNMTLPVAVALQVIALVTDYVPVTRHGDGDLG